MKIIFKDAWENEQTIDLAERELWILGSHSCAHLVLKRDINFRLSRIQCHISKVKEHWHIFDGCPRQPKSWAEKINKTPGSDSNRGTFVNGNKIGENGHGLRPGDRIQLVPVEQADSFSESIRPFEYYEKKYLYAGKVEHAVSEEETGDGVSVVDPGPAKENLLRINKDLEGYSAQRPDLDAYSYFRLLREVSLMESSIDAIKRVLMFAMENIRAAGFYGVYVYERDLDAFNPIAAYTRLGPSRERPSSTLLKQALEKGRCFIKSEEFQATGISESMKEIGLDSAIIIPYFAPSPGGYEPVIEGFLYMDNRGSLKPSNKEKDIPKATILSTFIQSIVIGKRSVTLAKRGEKMKWILEKFFSAPVAGDFLNRIDNDNDLNLKMDECKDATIFFLDIAGFTKTTSAMDAYQVRQLVKPFFEFLDTTHEHGGHGTKFIGDAVMAIFCKPLGMHQEIKENYDFAEKTLRAATSIITLWPEVIKKHRLPELSVRIGIHSGPVVVGNIGYESRFEYTAFGKTVNLASRMEKYAEPNGVAITEDTYKFLDDKKYHFEGPMEEDIKGIGNTNVYRLTNIGNRSRFPVHG